LLPDADKDRAVQLGERICAAVRQAGIEHRYSKVLGQSIITVSVGAASLTPTQRLNRRILFAIADDALYQAKKEGRNRVAFLSQPAQPLAEHVPCEISSKTIGQRIEAP
jgi:diguanylate cyclase (GGDEF)-like protein